MSFSQGGPFKTSSLPHQLSRHGDMEAPSCTVMHLQSAFTLGDLKNTCKQQYCHRLRTGKWNSTSFTVKEHDLVEEVKLFLDVIGISVTRHFSFKAVQLVDLI